MHPYTERPRLREIEKETEYNMSVNKLDVFFKLLLFLSQEKWDTKRRWGSTMNLNWTKKFFIGFLIKNETNLLKFLSRTKGLITTCAF